MNHRKRAFVSLMLILLILLSPVRSGSRRRGNKKHRVQGFVIHINRYVKFLVANY